MSHSSSDRSPSLLDRVRALCQRKGYSYRTEQTYARWIVRYVKYHDLTHPRDLEKQDVRDYLSYLATERSLAASTQNQALNALLFLHRDVLGRVGRRVKLRAGQRAGAYSRRSHSGGSEGALGRDERVGVQRLPRRESLPLPPWPFPLRTKTP